MDLENYETVKAAFDRVFHLVSRFEKRQNEDVLLIKRKIQKTLYRLKRTIKEDVPDDVVLDDYKNIKPLKPIWLDII